MTSPKPRRTVTVPERSLPVVAEADVVVVGGGTAGFVASIAAARTGARTVLAERCGYLEGLPEGDLCNRPGL